MELKYPVTKRGDHWRVLYNGPHATRPLYANKREAVDASVIMETGDLDKERRRLIVALYDIEQRVGKLAKA